jgi:hypothetical protein
MRLRQTIPVIGFGLALLGCGLADLFSAAKIGDVSITYIGPDVVRVGDTIPFSVTVTAGGAPMTDALVWITSSDTSLIALSVGSDTLFAKDNGFDTLTIRVVSSIFTDTFPTHVQQVRVLP